MKKSISIVVSFIFVLIAVEDSYTQSIFEVIRSGKLDSVKILVERYPELIKEKDTKNRTPLHWASIWGQPEVLKYLIENGADINALDKNNNTPLTLALTNGHRSLIGMLINDGADVNIKNGFGISPLHYAIRYNFTQEAEIIIKRGANLNAKVWDGKTPLHFASQNNKTDILKLLLLNGAKMDETDFCGNTPLHTAVYFGDIQAVNLFIDNKVNIHNKNNFGLTPLHQAAASGYLEIARSLLTQGARLDEKDNKSRTPLDLANNHNNTKLVKLLSPISGQKRVSSTLSSAKTYLKKDLKDGEAIIWHLGNNGWAVKTKNKLLIFDYWNYGTLPDEPSLANGHISKEELKDLNVYFFVTHGHYDHFDKNILDFESSGKTVKYIFGWNALENPKYIYFKDNKGEQIIDNVEICNIYDDSESGFLVKTDGIVIYHGGDYHGNYNSDLEYLSKKQEYIDILFNNYQYDKEHCIFAIKKLKPKIMFPMHHYGCECYNKLEAEELLTKIQQVKFIGVENRGECFFYSREKIK